MADRIQLCHSFWKEEPTDLSDSVSTVNRDDATSHDNNKDAKSPFLDQGKIITRSTTRDQYHVTVKEEPTEFMSVNHTVSGAQIKFSDSELHSPYPDAPDLCTIFTIEEMNMADFKTDEHSCEKNLLFKQSVQTQHLQHLDQRQQASKQTRSNPSPGTMMKIAKKYAEICSDEARHPSPYPRFRNKTYIQCPACPVPRDQSRDSAFLELLLHVRKRHSDNSDSVYHEIGRKYKSFIKSMKMKIRQN